MSHQMLTLHFLQVLQDTSGQMAERNVCPDDTEYVS